MGRRLDASVTDRLLSIEEVDFLHWVIAAAERGWSVSNCQCCGAPVLTPPPAHTPTREELEDLFRPPLDQGGES